MFYFIPGIYQPNTAATNRWLAYLRYFSESSIETRVVFFRRNSEGTSIESHPYISVNNYWERFYFNTKPLCYLSLLIYYIHFWCRLKKGDIILCYEQADVWKLFLKKGVKVFVEYTEHPDVVGLGGRFLYTSKRQFKAKCKKLSGLFVISSALKQYFITQGLEESRVHIINMIVDETRFEGIKKDTRVKPYIAYCGTVSNNKDGVDSLIKSFAIFSLSHPEVMLYIIGGIPSCVESTSNMKLINKMGIKDKVVLTGLVPSTAMPQLLKNACILALNRPDNVQAKYGFPTKLGEYLMSETPVVVTKVGDIPLFLKDGLSAFLVEPNDTKSFADKLCVAYENKELSTRIAMEGKRVAKTHFSYAKVTNKMVRIMGLK